MSRSLRDCQRAWNNSVGTFSPSVEPRRSFSSFQTEKQNDGDDQS